MAQPRFDPVLGKAAFGLSMQPLTGVLPTVSDHCAAGITVGQALLAVEPVSPRPPRTVPTLLRQQLILCCNCPR